MVPGCNDDVTSMTTIGTDSGTETGDGDGDPGDGDGDGRKPRGAL